MLRDTLRHDRPGVALALVLLVLLAVGALSTAATMITSNAVLINRYDETQSVLQATVDAGLEEARSRLNSNRALYPDTGHIAIENGDTVRDAAGHVIPGISRWIYTGPTGSTTGQYGVFGSIVTVAEDGSGDRVVRRLEIVQESFAKFAYFTNDEGDIWFGGGDQIDGPVHSNDVIKIHSTGATFKGPVTTAQTILHPGNGEFQQGYTQHAPVIPMPPTAELDRLQGYATAGGMALATRFTNIGGPRSSATMRIEFVARDLNNDGDSTDVDEGFIRIFDSTDSRYVTAVLPAGGDLRNSLNCGDYHGGDFVAAVDHPGPPPDPANENPQAALENASARCYLGGADELFDGVFTPGDPGSEGWRPWPDDVKQRIIDAGANAPDSAYLFPISRALNPNFKGVIHVNGSVAVSGTVRGHITLAATGDIIIADDLQYATFPGAQDRNCTDEDDANDDMLGLFAQGDILIADNTINAPTRITQSGSNYLSFDDTTGEIVHAVILTLEVFTVDNYSSGSTRAEPCGTTQWGRGCLFLTGGIIQRERGPVGQADGHGYVKRYSYDHCAAQSPPPYYPTTGVFDRGRVFEVDPVGFDIDEYFALLTAGS